MLVLVSYVQFQKGENKKLPKLRKFTFLWISSIFVIFTVGCQSMNQFSPEQVIANALESDENITYYGELLMSFEGMEGLEDTKIKEWRKNEKVRLEMSLEDEAVTIVLDGESTLVYNESEKKAFLSVLANELDVENLYVNPREQVELMLELVQDTHDIETVGEETIAGRESIHMVAKRKEGVKSLYGNQEMWIDKENWLLLKFKSMSGDVQVSMEYTKIDFDVDNDDSLFELDVPDDVEVKDVSNDFDQESEISLEEIPEKLEQPVLYIPDDEEHQIDKISFIEMEGEFSYKDVTIDYKRSDGLPLMSLTLLQGDGNEQLMEEERKALEEIGDFIQIRDKEAHYMHQQQFHHVSWAENGINYSIHLIDPNSTIEDVQKWTEEMVEIK